MKKLPILIFEGMDKTGKTTLMKELGKKTGFRYVVVDRGPIGFTTYNMLFDRNLEDVKAYNQMELDLLRVPHLVIYCRPHLFTILNRLKEHKEELPKGTDIDDHIKMYDWRYGKSKLNKVSINTDKSIDECIDEIIKHAEAISNEQYEQCE